MAKEEKVIRIKVKPYPIPFELVGGPKPIKGQILKLTEIGFFSDMAKQILQVSEKYTARFEIPLSHAPIQGPVVVFKTQDQVKPKYDVHQKRNVGVEVVRLTEIHFVSLTSEQRVQIQKFMTAIGQSE